MSTSPVPAPSLRLTSAAPTLLGSQLRLASAVILTGACLGAFVAALSLQPPRVVPATAPASVFSGERAMAELRTFAVAPRMVGLPGHALAAGEVEARLRALGLTPEVQQTQIVNRFPGAPVFFGGAVRNVMAKIPGTASTGAVLLGAHYDSGATGNGAADCGACVVSVLETARALLAGPALRNDVILLFTDAEENGDLGAAAFTAQHPWMRDVRFAVNLEAMGLGGPAVAYWTTPGTTAIVGTLARTGAAVTTSFMTGLSELLGAQQPGCDGEEYGAAGARALTILFTSESVGYHTALDTPSRIDPRSVQHQGALMLALARELGGADLAALQAEDGESIFFNVHHALVRYPRALAIPFALLAALIALLAIIAVLQDAPTNPARLSAGAVLSPVLMLLAAAAPVVVWVAVRALNPNLQVFLVGSYATGVFVAALIAVALGAYGLLQALCHRIPGLTELRVGGLSLWAMLAVGTAILFPQWSYLFCWPLLFVALPAVLSARWPRARWLEPVGLAVGVGVLALLWLPALAYPLGPFMARFDTLTGAPLLAVPAVFAAVTGPLLARPFTLGMEAVGRWLPSGALLLGAAVLLGIGWSRTGFDEAHPRGDRIAWELDVDRDRAEWVSDDRRVDAYTARFFDRDAQPVPSPDGAPRLRAPAPRAAVQAPVIETVMDERTSTGLRRLALRVRSPRQAPVLELEVRDAGAIRQATVEGQRLDLAAYAPAHEGTLALVWQLLPEDGLLLTLEVAGGERLQLRVADTSSGFPPELGAQAPRPPATMPAPGSIPEATVVRRQYTL